MAEKNASAAQTAQMFPIERLAKACRTLFNRISQHVRRRNGWHDWRIHR